MAQTAIDVRNYEIDGNGMLYVDHDSNQDIVPLSYHPGDAPDEPFAGLRRQRASVTFAIVERTE